MQGCWRGTASSVAAGLAAGYVIGARAGRPAYDAVVERVHGMRESSAVQQVGAKAKETLEERAPQVADVVEKAAGVAAGAASAAKDAGSSSADESDAPSEAGVGSTDASAASAPPTAKPQPSKRSGASADSAA